VVALVVEDISEGTNGGGLGNYRGGSFGGGGYY
jgi:hypothetical protein